MTSMTNQLTSSFSMLRMRYLQRKYSSILKRQGDADILMMTRITYHCLFMPHLPSVTHLFSSTFETIRNLVLNTKPSIGRIIYFYLLNLPLVVLVPLGRQKIHCSMDSSFPSSQLFSSSSQSACLSDLKA